MAGAGNLAVSQAVTQPIESNPNLPVAANGILNTVSTITLAALSAALDAVQADLAIVVQRALEQAHLSLWRNNRRQVS